MDQTKTQMTDEKTLACGEEATTTNRWEECLAVHGAGVETEDPFGSF